MRRKGRRGERKWKSYLHQEEKKTHHYRPHKLERIRQNYEK
jgi:hypothetical protein